MPLMDVGSAFIHMERPVQNMDMLPEPLLNLPDKIIQDCKELFTGNRFFYLSNLINCLLRAGHPVFQ